MKNNNDSQKLEKTTSKQKRDKQIETLIKEALEKKDFHLVYQPQLNITTGKVHSIEALIRWNHRIYNTISPTEFIPIAESCGLISSIGSWVINQAGKDYYQLTKISQDLKISINVSMKQLENECLYSSIHQLINTYPINPKNIKLEITETADTQHFNQVLESTTKITSLGVSFSLDDFGTSYSSILRLKQLPITEIKLDKSFVRDINISDKSEIIIKSIIQLSKTLGITVVAEGVETRDQYDYLKQNGCVVIQGNFFCKPTSIRHLTTLLKTDL